MYEGLIVATNFPTPFAKSEITIGLPTRAWQVAVHVVEPIAKLWFLKVSKNGRILFALTLFVAVTASAIA